jgi:hypothetical protein
VRRAHQISRLVALALVATLALAACSSDDDKPTPTGVAPVPSPTTTIDKGPATPGPTDTPSPSSTPRATLIPVAGLPDGPLLALSPASGIAVGSQAVLVRGTIASGAIATVNGVEMDPDLAGDFFVAVAVGSGTNSIIVEVTGTDGTMVRKELRVTGS